MRRLSGYSTWTDPDRPLVERDTCRCGHCGAIIHVKPGTAATTYLILDRATLRYREEPGAACRMCMTPVCLACDADGRCTPLERRLEEMERRSV